MALNKTSVRACNVAGPMRKRTGKATAAEWVTLMALIGERDREAFRALRREAWESVVLQNSSRIAN